MISKEDMLYYIDDALDGMIAIVEELGDDLANRRLDVGGANSPYAVLTHCLGVIDYWCSYLIAGREIERDRAAEFRSAGSVSELVTRVRSSRLRLESDLLELEPSAPPRGTARPGDARLPIGATQGGALVHIYEELAQHRGQMEVTRDVLLAPWGASKPVSAP
ncbi:MAG TPA: DinB family protein [Acidimicrobiales bacterium]|nr:DinB family protein [Acidimicrobiales bacterium]